MAAALSILLPVFALIGAGIACRRFGALGPNAASELNRFVVWLGLPALLFDIVAHSHWAQIWQRGFIGAFGLATAMVFTVTFVLRRVVGRSTAEAGIEAVAASYSNTGYVGFPLALLAFGAGSQTQVTLATLFVVCVLFAAAIVIVESDLQGGLHLGTVGKVALSLARNPLIVAPVAGTVFAGMHWSLPVPVATCLQLLGAAASPVALVSLGLFLGEKRVGGARRGVPLVLTFAKLVVMPGLTWLLATSVFRLPNSSVQVAVLMAALPTGTGPFMLAEFYRRGEAVSAQTTLWSTVLSIVTLSWLLAYGLRGG